MRKWEVLQRNSKWVAGCKITESCFYNNQSLRRFTATINGWTNFLIYEGDIRNIELQQIIEKVEEIKQQIEQGSEEVFHKDHRIVI